MNITDFIPAGETIVFSPAYTRETKKRWIAEGNAGYRATVLENGKVLTEEGDEIGFTTLTFELLSYKGDRNNLGYTAATKHWVYAGIRVSHIYDEMMTDLYELAA